MTNFLFSKCPKRFFWIYPKISSSLIFIQVFLLLFLFQPFGLRTLSLNILTLLCLLYAFIGGISYYVSFRIWNVFSGENWTYIKDIAWASVIFLIIGCLNYFATFILSSYLKNSFDKYSESLTFFESISYTVLIGWGIYLFIIIADDFLTKHFVKKSILEDSKVEEFDKAFNLEEKILIEGKNNQDEILLNPSNILYTEASGNYVYIFIIDQANAKVEKLCFRTSIKELNTQFEALDFLYSCHRSFIVNFNFINEVQGNSKSKQILIKSSDEELIIPISRLKIKEFDLQFNNFNQS